MDEAVSRAAVQGERHIHSLIGVALQMLQEIRDVNFVSDQTPAQTEQQPPPPPQQQQQGSEAKENQTPRPPSSITKLETLQKQYIETHSHIVGAIKIICSQIHRIKKEGERFDREAEDVQQLIQKRDRLRQEVYEGNGQVKQLIDRMRLLQDQLTLLQAHQVYDPLHGYEPLSDPSPAVKADNS